MAYTLNQSPSSLYRGINGFRYALAHKKATAAGADLSRLECLVPNCDGNAPDEKAKAEIVSLALDVLNAGLDLDCLPNVCDCEVYACTCPTEILDLLEDLPVE